MQLKSAVRAAGIKNLSASKGGLKASEEHGKRLDVTSKKRIVTERNSLNWSKAGEDAGLDLVAAYKAHKAEIGAKERANTEIGTHLIVTVSPEWISEIGGLHDPANPRIQELIINAKAWAESWQGKGSVYAWRYDLDEKGGAVVDLFTAPVREQGRRNGKTEKTISPNMAKNELTKAMKERTSGAAFQTSWAAWASTHLDKRLQRGKRKDETRREHVHAEIYARIAEAAKKDNLVIREAKLAQDWRSLKAKQVKWLLSKGDVLQAAVANEKQRLESLEKELAAEVQITRDTRARLERAESMAASKMQYAHDRSNTLDSEERKFNAQVQDIKKIQAENTELKAENKGLKEQLEIITKLAERRLAFTNYIKEKLKELLPGIFEKIKAAIIEGWKTHPTNPDNYSQDTEGPETSHVVDLKMG